MPCVFRNIGIMQHIPTILVNYAAPEGHVLSRQNFTLLLLKIAPHLQRAQDAPPKKVSPVISSLGLVAKD